MARVLFTLGGNPQGKEPKNRPKPVHTWANGRGHTSIHGCKQAPNMRGDFFECCTGLFVGVMLRMIMPLTLKF